MQADKLREEELRAVRSAMANAEHDAGDVDDVPPRIEDDEDAYWAYCTYHGLRKLLAIAEASEGLRADAMRYRWMRDVAEEEWKVTVWRGKGVEEILYDEILDEAIDSAMAGAVTQGEGPDGSGPPG